MRFADIPGHDKEKIALAAAADSGRVPHAILLSGPEGIGKLALARAFAQYLHCENRSGGDSCGVCPSCRQHKSLNQPDVHYVYPVVKRKPKAISKDYLEEWRELLQATDFPTPGAWQDALDAATAQPRIYVDESAEIVRVTSLSPLIKDQKVFIIWQAEKLMEEAANKLLKVIEEPFADTVFLLVSSEPQKILPTIFSRTQRFNLKPLPQEKVAHWLHAVQNIDPAESAELARLSEGRPAAALDYASLGKEPEEFADQFRTMMRAAYTRNVAELKRLSENAASFGREKLKRFLSYTAAQVRENFIRNFGYPELNRMRAEEEEFSRKFSPFIHLGNVGAMNRELTRAISDVEGNANSKLVMFDLYLNMMTLIRKPKP